MKRSAVKILAFAAFLQSGAVSAAECPSNYVLRSPYWSVSPMITTMTPGASMPINGAFKISMLMQTFTASDGMLGCIGDRFVQKDMPDAVMNPAPPALCTQATIAGATLIENNGITSTAVYTFIGRIPLSKQGGALNTSTNYDYRITIRNGKTDSVCYSAVASDGTSEFWDGR